MAIIEAKKEATRTSNPVKDRLIHNLDWIRAKTNDLVKDFPTDKALHQPSPTDNHLIWALGHLALTDEWIHSMLDPQFKSILPESYKTLFYGSKCEGDPKKYPTLNEVRKNFDAAHESLMKTVKAASEQTLNKSVKEVSGGFAEDGYDALFKGVWHEGWHSGQIAGLRKSLNLKSIF